MNDLLRRKKEKMITQNSLDKKYISIRDGVVFHYFGSGCMAEFFSSVVAYLDEKDITIVQSCGGQQMWYEIQKDLLSKYVWDTEELDTRLTRLIKKGVLVSRKGHTKAMFSGVKGLYSPREIVFELTNACNYKCPFCYKEANAKGKFIEDQIVQNINKAISGHVRNVLLTGGEPTLHPHFLDYIELFAEYAKVHTITNGSTFYEYDPNILKKLDLVQFSIYGCNDQEYLKMTGSQLGFTHLAKSIEFAQKNGIEITTAVTLCQDTMDHIDDFVNVALNFEVPTLRLGIADMFGRGKSMYDPQAEFEKKKTEALNYIVELKRKHRQRLKIEVPNINTAHVEVHDDIYSCVHRGSLRCGCGSEYIVISPSGQVRPCQMLPEQWFAVQSANALEEHISGNFHLAELRKSVEMYYADQGYQISKYSPCYGLDLFMSSEDKNVG